MTTATLSPSVAVANRPARVTFTLEAAATSNYVRAWCTAAPEGSALQEQIDRSRLSRALVYEGPGGTKVPWRYTFDRGGRYSLTVQEYTKGNAWGGGYEGDPRGAPTETKAGTEETLELFIAQRLTQRLGTGDDTATLVLFVREETIVSTVASVHGESSPAVVDWASSRAETAAQTAATRAAVAALAGLTTTTTLGDPGSVVDHMIAEFQDHANSGTFHLTADDQDDLEDNYSGSTSLSGVAEALNKLRSRFTLHTLNARENDPDHPEYQAPGAVAMHTGFDLANGLLDVTADEGDPATIYAAIGDYWRAHEGHRTAGVHDAPDSTNDLNTLTGLLLVHKEFMSTLAALEPTAQAGQSSGAAALIGSGGFVEA